MTTRVPGYIQLCKDDNSGTETGYKQNIGDRLAVMNDDGMNHGYSYDGGMNHAYSYDGGMNHAYSHLINY